jgi:hypothetical protein
MFIKTQLNFNYSGLAIQIIQIALKDPESSLALPCDKRRPTELLFTLCSKTKLWIKTAYFPASPFRDFIKHPSYVTVLDVGSSSEEATVAEKWKGVQKWGKT